MPEIVVTVSSADAAAAAVQSGANAVCVRFSGKGFKKACGSFSKEAIFRCVQYCRVRGCALYIKFDGVCSGNDDILSALELAQWAQQSGANALAVSDLGLLRALHQALPDMPLHLSSESGIHSLQGALFVKELGASRICLPAELPKEYISYIASHCAIETEITVLSPLCAAYSGACTADSVLPPDPVGCSRCAKSCHNAFSMGRIHNVRPFVMSGFSLAGRFKDISRCRVSAVSIEASDMTADETAEAAALFARLAKGGKNASEQELSALKKMLGVSSLTDCYFDGSTEAAISGTPVPPSGYRHSDHNHWLHEEKPFIPLEYAAVLQAGKRFRLAARDAQGNTASAEGPVPSYVTVGGLTKIELQTQLFRARKTPFTVGSLSCRIDDNLYIPRDVIESMQQAIFAELSAKRGTVPLRSRNHFTPAPASAGYILDPKFTVSLLRASQLSQALIDLAPALVVLPVEEAAANPEKLESFVGRSDTIFAVSLPRIIRDDEEKHFSSLLARAANMGIKDVFISDPGQFKLASRHAQNIRGDISLNIFNSETLALYAERGLASAVLPFETSFHNIKNISKPIDTELVVYGRMPLMLTESCIIKNVFGTCSCDSPAELRMPNGDVYPILRTHKCRNLVLSAEKLFLAKRKKHWSALGIWGARLSFTTENARECEAVLRRYMGQGEYQPNRCTRGFYYSSTY